MNPALLVIAGPNGAGKTTVTARLRADWNSPDAVLRAARWAEARREHLLANGSGIAFETVFSAPDKVDFVYRARLAGYFVPCSSSGPATRASTQRASPIA